MCTKLCSSRDAEHRLLFSLEYFKKRTLFLVTQTEYEHKTRARDEWLKHQHICVQGQGGGGPPSVPELYFYAEIY
jgi:hypothetical protein